MFYTVREKQISTHLCTKYKLLEGDSQERLLIFLEIFNLLHDLTEHFGAVLRWVSVFYKADFDIHFEGVAHILIIEPVGK